MWGSGLFCALLDAELAVDFFAGCGGFLFAFAGLFFVVFEVGVDGAQCVENEVEA